MNKNVSGLFTVCIIVLISCSAAFAGVSAVERPIFMVHYMPWYQTPAVSGSWGWHWTMNFFNPDLADPAGQREIASHYYPLTGPYDSNDETILEYQVLLMKLSGIDGVLVDWYGMVNFMDYGLLNKSTHALFDMIQKTELHFGIVYEDQTIKHMIDNGYLAPNRDIEHGKLVMQYLEDQWFETEHYLKLNAQPILLTFGPQYFKVSSSWESMFSGLSAMPLFFTLDNRLSPAAAGAYPWPPMWKVNANQTLSQRSLNDYLDQFYQKSASWDYLVTSAFPGFNDIYKEAGVSEGYGFLDAQNGATFRSTLQQALDHDPDVIQLVTWNDYGEGTIIEPTSEFGYQYLEILQDFRSSVDSTFEFQYEDLQIPLQIFQLRQTAAGDSAVNAALDNAFDLIFADNLESARTVIDSLLHPVENIPGKRALKQNVPNPFNSTTTIRYSLTKNDHAVLKICSTRGQVLETLVNKEQQKGDYELPWDAGGYSSGLYFCTLKSGSVFETVKLVLLK